MKIIFRVFLSFFFLILLLAGAGVAVWMRPAIVLTDARVHALAEKYAGNLFSKFPETLHLDLTPYTFSGKRVHLEASAFCLKDPEACFKTASIDFAFKWVGLTQVKIHEIGPITILNESFTYTVIHNTPTVAPTPAPSSSSIFNHVHIPPDVAVKNVSLDFPNVVIKNGKEIIHGEFNLNGKATRDVTLSAKVTSNERLEGNLQMHTSFVLDQENPFDAKVHLHAGGMVDGNLNGKVEWSKLEGDILGELKLRKFTPWLNTVYVKNLHLARANSQTHLSADVDTKLEQTMGFGNVHSVLPKASFNLDIHGKIDAVSDKDGNRYEIDLGPTEDKGIYLQSKAAGVFPFPKGEEYKFGLNHFYFKFNIPKFETLVKSLRKTNFAIPAPFSALKGNAFIEIGNADGDLEGDTLPAKIVTRLNSAEQTIETESKGTITLAPKPKKLKIIGESKIEAVRFTMPDVKVLEPAPLIKNDPRLVSTQAQTKSVKKKKVAGEEKESASSIDLQWKVTTSPSGIKIYHPVLKPYAPIEVNWMIGDPAHGSISLNPFEIEYLNRVAKVDKLRFYENAGDPKFHYEGKISVQKTEYTVFIEIIQDGDSPRVVLSSEPPLGDSDIISVLLFNQTAAELDSDQTNSVASTQSAVANRALGLFSVLALSSTPVEAVNFNPTTGVYSARVKLANGLTATVGTDWDKTQEVALRKRLGKNFVLTAILETDIDPITNSSTETRETLIEWFRRF
jgi:hypothetical protein